MGKKLLLLAYGSFLLNSLMAQTVGNGFYFPSEIVIDSKGNLYVTGKNNKIIQVSPDGKPRDFAGSPRGGAALKDGIGTGALFNATRGMAIDKDDNIYLADYNTIRKITPGAVVTTIYGNGNKAIVMDGDRTTALFHSPEFVAVDHSGVLYVTDEIFDSTELRTYNIIRKISPHGRVTTIRNPDGSLFRAAWIYGLACDKDLNLYLSAVDWSSCIMKITPDGTITTVAGRYDHKHRVPFKEGDLNTARFTVTWGIAVDKNGDVYFSDAWEHRIVRVANNRATVVAGGAGGGYRDGRAKQALLTGPHGIAMDNAGNLFIVDAGNSCIRKLSTDGVLSTFCMPYFDNKTSQYVDPPSQEKGTVTTNSKTPNETDLMLQTLQKQIDSAMNDPKIRKYIKDARAVNIDSINQAAWDAARNSVQNQQSYYSSTSVLPKKKTKTLARLPKKAMTTDELKTYLTDLDKKLTPAFRNAYGTPVANTDAYDASTISKSAILAMEAGLLDQAVLLSLKAAEKSPDDLAVLNNTGVVLQKGGIEIAAIPVLESALQKDPGNSTIQNNIGQSYLSLGDREKAEQYLQRCVNKVTYHPLANSSLALIYLEKGNKQTALKYTENSLRGSFTDRAWHLLFRLKKDPSMMDYIRHRYKQPEYFNEDKYKLPLQCERVSDIQVKKAEYRAYRDMVESVKKKFDEMAAEENRIGLDSMMQRAKKGRIRSAPFMELANAMLLDKKLKMDKGEWEEVGRSQKKYHEQIKILQDEYNSKQHNAEGCGAQIALADEYMEKMSVVTHEYQKTYLRIYKDFYHYMAFWSLFASPDRHMQRGAFCGLTSSLLGVLLQIAETHFLNVTIDCASNEELKREAEEIEIKEECPIGEDGFEIPFGVGKFNLSCEKVELQLGEVLILNASHKFTSGETTLAIGPGLSVVGPSHEAMKHVPELPIGPLKFSLDVGAKQQVFLTFDKNGQLMDYGSKFTAEFDVLGIAKEFSTGYTVGANTGIEMEGPLKNVVDKVLDLPKEDPQINKNIKKYQEHK